MSPNRFVLGTAGLGQRYGIDNVRVPPEQAVAIVRAGAKLGAAGIATSPAYGNAEALVGEAGVPTPVHTKLDGELAAKASTLRSLERLGRERVDVMYVPDLERFANEREYRREVEGLVGDLVAALGATVYEPAEAQQALDLGAFAVMQIPINALDRRWQDVLRKATDRGVSVHARSVFLQGALLAEPRSHPFLWDLDPTIERLGEAASAIGRSRVELLLTAVRDTAGIDALVLGVESLEELRDNAALLDAPPLTVDEHAHLLAIPDPPEAILDPRRWDNRPQNAAPSVQHSPEEVGPCA